MARAVLQKEYADGNSMRRDLREKLAARIGRIENRTALMEDGEAVCRVPLGIPAIDMAFGPKAASGTAPLPGMPANTLHEIRVDAGLEAASGAGFALAIGLVLARGLQAGKQAANPNPGKNFLPPVFWIADPYIRAEYGAFHGPGLAAFGLSPGALIRITPASMSEALWAAGEIAAAGGAASLLILEIRGNPKEPGLATTRRLKLRANRSGIPVIILRQSGHADSSAAITRWHVAPAPSTAHPGAPPNLLGPPAFAVTLEKCSTGYAGNSQWTLEWNCHEQTLCIAGTAPSRRISAPSLRPAGGRTAGTASAPLPFPAPAQIADRSYPQETAWPDLAG